MGCWSEGVSVGVATGARVSHSATIDEHDDGSEEDVPARYRRRDDQSKLKMHNTSGSCQSCEVMRYSTKAHKV